MVARRRGRRLVVDASIILVVIAVVGSLLGCAGTANPKTTAQPAVPASLATATGPSLTASVQQYGIADAPSGGQVEARPKLNSQAAQYYDSGMRAFQVGDLDGATSQFEKATEADAQAYQAYYSLGVIRERRGNNAGALAAYAKSIGIVSNYEPAIVAYGILTARQGNVDEAEQYLNGRLAKMEKSAAVTAALAEVKSLRGDSGAAQRLAQEALKINPDYRPAMILLARDHYRNRRLDLALYSLQGILDGYGPENPPRDKGNPEALLIRGLIHKERNERAPAMDDFRRAVEIRPDLVEARIHLAGYLLESGNAVNALPHLEAALRYDRDNLLARLNLGDAYRLLGRTGEAKQQLEWVVKQNPKLSQAHYSLGLMYLFSSSVPGVAPKEAASKAVAEFEEYKSSKPRASAGQADDADELINAAKSKKGVLEAQQEETTSAQAGASQPKASANTATGGGKTKAPQQAASSSGSADGTKGGQQ